jgi:hypothetical protein
MRLFGGLGIPHALPAHPAQRAGRLQPGDEAAGRFPGNDPRRSPKLAGAPEITWKLRRPVRDIFSKSRDWAPSLGILPTWAAGRGGYS